MGLADEVAQMLYEAIQQTPGGARVWEARGLGLNLFDDLTDEERGRLLEVSVLALNQIVLKLGTEIDRLIAQMGEPEP